MHAHHQIWLLSTPNSGYSGILVSQSTHTFQNWLETISLQNELTANEYVDMMKDGLEDLACDQLRALVNVEANKARLARWYDKKVKIEEFSQGDLVWKLILSIGSRDQKYGKMVSYLGGSLSDK
jgi:hypothetical protein